jgi:hypothetical protein
MTEEPNSGSRLLIFVSQRSRIPMISNRQAVAMAAVMGEGLKPLTIR